MGQYYQVVNVDKRECVNPSVFHRGASKLLEWACFQWDTMSGVMNLMAGRWKNDRIYFVGDYADDSNPKEPCHLALVAAMRELGTDYLFGWANDHCTPIVLPDFDGDSYVDDDNIPHPVCEERLDTSDRGWNYVVNHDLKVFVRLPREWKTPTATFTYEPPFIIRHSSPVAPLPLLLAMGNGRGGGDYGGFGDEHVGSWCDSSASLEVCRELSGKAKEYQELCPGFDVGD